MAVQAVVDDVERVAYKKDHLANEAPDQFSTSVNGVEHDS